MAKEAKRQADAAVVETRDADEFASVLQQSFKPRSERAATEVENAVTTLVEQALADTSLVKGEVLDTIEEMIARPRREADRAGERDHHSESSSRSKAPGAG
jgi:type VI secretion system protein ImpC